MSQRPVRLAILNDFEVVVRGVQAMLAPFEDRVEVVELAADVPVRAVVDVTLYDTFGEEQLDLADLDHQAGTGTAEAGAVAVYSWNVSPQLVELALARGCRGYLDKSLPAEELVTAVERLAHGEVVVAGVPDEAGPADARIGWPGVVGARDWPGREAGLSPREAEVVALIAQGLTNTDIASRTYLSINSVKTYIRAAYRKMGVTRRSQAVLWGLEHGMLPDRVRVRHPGSATG